MIMMMMMIMIIFMMMMMMIITLIANDMIPNNIMTTLIPDNDNDGDFHS